MKNDPLTPYANKPVVTPIVSAINYQYTSFEVLRLITDGEMDSYTYHGDDNPTVRTVEKLIAELEGAEDCVICTTGMAGAIACSEKNTITSSGSRGRPSEQRWMRFPLHFWNGYGT